MIYTNYFDTQKEALSFASKHFKKIKAISFKKQKDGQVMLRVLY